MEIPVAPHAQKAAHAISARVLSLARMIAAVIVVNVRRVIMLEFNLTYPAQAKLAD